MLNKNKELVEIIERFAQSQWDILESPCKSWLDAKDAKEEKYATTKLIIAIQNAKNLCGTCGCEFDAMYVRALELLD